MVARPHEHGGPEDKAATELGAGDLGTSDDLTRLAGRLLRLQDEERRDMARELHDTTIQNLAAAHILADRMRKSIERVAGPALQYAVEEVQALIIRSLEELRRFSILLDPPLLRELGLVSALRSWIGEFERRTGIAVVLLDDRYDTGARKTNVEEVIFHVVEKALANIHRHSVSDSVQVRLMRNGSETVVEIAYPASDRPSGDVTDSIRARLQPLGGKFQILSSSSGTRVTARVPSDDACDRMSDQAAARVTTGFRQSVPGAEPKVRDADKSRMSVHPS
jgi:signal transduction histidine kinase